MTWKQAFKESGGLVLTFSAPVAAVMVFGTLLAEPEFAGRLASLALAALAVQWFAEALHRKMGDA